MILGEGVIKYIFYLEFHSSLSRNACFCTTIVRGLLFFESWFDGYSPPRPLRERGWESGFP